LSTPVNGSILPPLKHPRHAVIQPRILPEDFCKRVSVHSMTHLTGAPRGATFCRSHRVLLWLVESRPQPPSSLTISVLSLPDPWPPTISMASWQAHTCPSDDTFGPIVHGCRDDFDFTLLFEHLFFTIVPCTVFIFASVCKITQLCRVEQIANRKLLQGIKSVR
jgi:hypothetical protein